jgi:hypothetical protein
MAAVGIGKGLAAGVHSLRLGPAGNDSDFRSRVASPGSSAFHIGRQEFQPVRVHAAQVAVDENPPGKPRLLHRRPHWLLASYFPEG